MKKLLLLLTLALCAPLTFAQNVPSYVPTDGLIGYWPFNGDANDVSGNNNNGTVNGATLTTDRFGNSNGAYSFDGVLNTIRTPINLIQGNKITFSIWFLNSNLIPLNNSDHPTLIGSRVAFNQFTGIGFNSTNLYFDIINYSYRNQSNQLLPVDNLWHNIIATCEGSSSKIFIDGQLSSTQSVPNISNIVQNVIYFGKDEIGGYGNRNWNGKLDDIAIYNRALTQEEITQLYYAENTCQSLVINTGVLSFNPPTYNNTVTIYPNPANDHITIDCGNLANVSGWSIKIFNTLGQEVFSGAMNTQQYVVPLNTWSGQGIYFVKIYDASNQLMNTKKIILQ